MFVSQRCSCDRVSRVVRSTRGFARLVDEVTIVGPGFRPVEPCAEVVLYTARQGAEAPADRAAHRRRVHPTRCHPSQTRRTGARRQVTCLVFATGVRCSANGRAADAKRTRPACVAAAIARRSHRTRQALQRAASNALAEFDVKDLRIMIGQQISLRHLIPRAITISKRTRWPKDMYPGDLLGAVLLDKAYSACEREQWQEVEAIERGLVSAYEELRDSIEAFTTSTFEGVGHRPLGSVPVGREAAGSGEAADCLSTGRLTIPSRVGPRKLAKPRKSARKPTAVATVTRGTRSSPEVRSIPACRLPPRPLRWPRRASS